MSTEQGGGFMFWLIEHRHLPGAQMWDDEKSGPVESIICPLAPEDHRRAKDRWASAMLCEGPGPQWTLNRTFDAFTTPGNSFVFTRRVFTALKEEGLTGWLMNPAIVAFADGSVSEDFGELWVNGFGGVAQPSTGHKLLWRCRGCGQCENQGAVDFMNRAAMTSQRGFFIEPRGGFDFGAAVRQARWDGSDFFIVWPCLGRPICTDSAKGVLERFHINELLFKKPEEMEPLPFCNDAPAVPPFYKPAARAEIEAYWAEAPVWPDDFEKPAP